MNPREERFAAWKASPGRETLVALLESIQGRVFAVCHGVLGHREEAEEAAQETLLKVVSEIDGIGDAQHFERWLGKVATRTALDRGRAGRRRKARDAAWGAGRATTAEPWDGLHDAIRRLPEDERNLIVERYFERRTLEEMADRRGLSDAGVRKRIEKAHGRLKRMLGSFLGVGVMTGKSKAAVVIAVVVPLLILGTGVWVATVKTGARQEEPKVVATSIPMAKEVAAPVTSAVPKPPDPVATLEAPLDRTRLRAEIVACWERLLYASRRSAECKRIWPEATTQEEYLRLVHEKEALDKECRELRVYLPELAARDPATIIDVVKQCRDLPDRLRLIGLIAPDVESEISLESGASGPLSSALLTLATGDAEEKTHLAAFAGRLNRANHALGRALITFLGDTDAHVRNHAGQALESLASKGILLGFLQEHIPALRQAALLDGEQLDDALRTRALMALAWIGAESSDEFVLEQFEAADRNRVDYNRLRAAVIAGKRLATRHEVRLSTAILRAFDSASDPGIYYTLLQLAEYLPERARSTVTQAAAARKPEPSDGNVPRIMATGPKSNNRAPRRSLIGVDRWELGPATTENSPSLRIR